MQKSSNQSFIAHLYAKSKGIDSILIAVSDITERKQAEEALIASETKAKAIIKYAPTAIYEIDIQGTRFISVNDAMSTITGYTRVV